MAVIRLSHIGKTLEQLPTLEDITLCVADNELVFILGPSGCGKSTLLNIVAGLILPDRGTVEIDGEDWSGRSGRVSYMLQKDLLLPSRNILDNVCIPLLLQGESKKQARQAARAYFKDFGLEGFESYYPGQLSGGMRQRAALLRTHLFASDLMLLDEPFASLDAISRRQMQLWLKNLRRQYRSSVLFVTHDIEEALLLADRIYIFSARPARVTREFNLIGISQDRRREFQADILELLEPKID